jgi:hypothetical protein
MSDLIDAAFDRAGLRVLRGHQHDRLSQSTNLTSA